MSGKTMKQREPFKPHRSFMKLYYSYLLMAETVIFIVVILPVIAAALIYAPEETVVLVVASLILPFLAAVFSVAFWIPKYYASVSYSFTEAEIVVERGVWWKHESTVPYNRVTNIDIVQGPISRRFGLAKIRVQTAGYSAPSGGATAEATIFGVKNFEEIRDFILTQVRGLRPVGVEAAAEAMASAETGQQMLAELKRIRDILEKGLER